MLYEVIELSGAKQHPEAWGGRTQGECGNWRLGTLERAPARQCMELESGCHHGRSRTSLF